MKKVLLITIIIVIALSITFSFIGCKSKITQINTDFEDVPEGATIATGLSALTLFDQAIATTYAGDFKRVNTLDFTAEPIKVGSLGGTQTLDEICEYYKVGDTMLRNLVAKGAGSEAKDNTGIKVFYYNGTIAKIAEATGESIEINFEDVDYSQIEDLVEDCTNTEDRLEDYNNFTSYVRTTDKLAEDHVDEVYVYGNLYYATIKFDMNVGTINSGIQEAIDRAVEGATGSIANTITWQQNTVWNCIFEKIGDDFYLKKTYLYEVYTGKTQAFGPFTTTVPCSQSHISEFFYGEDIDVPQNLIELLGMDN